MVTRRNMIIGGTASTLGLSSGCLSLFSDTASAKATVSISSLETKDVTLRPQDGEVYAPWLVVTGDYSYSVESEPEEREIFILIGDGDGNVEPIEVTSETTNLLSDSGSYEIQADITVSSYYSSSDFSVGPDGGPTTISIPAEVALVIRNSNDEMMIQARQSGIVTITVEQGGTSAQISGTTDVLMQDDESDPVP